MGISVADLNNDGHLDLVRSDKGDGNITVLLGKATGHSRQQRIRRQGALETVGYRLRTSTGTGSRTLRLYRVLARVTKLRSS